MKSATTKATETAKNADRVAAAADRRAEEARRNRARTNRINAWRKRSTGKRFL